MRQDQQPRTPLRAHYPTLHQLAIFLAVARLRSFSRAGDELARYAHSALDQLDEAMLVIGELRGMERGRLRVAADTTAGVYVVPGPLGAFKARYPQITISMSVVNRATVQEKLLTHEVDLAVMGHTVPGDYLVVTTLLR